MVGGLFNMNLTPIVIEQTNRGERSYDIYSRLLKDRIILVFSAIDDALSASIISQLLFLDSQGQDDIYMYINSPGGSVSAGLAIYDVMNYIKPNVVTIGIGLCASMGAFLLSSGTKGKRYALENTKVMIHQPMGGAEGQTTDILIVAEEMSRIKKLINEILAKNTNQPLKKITSDTERDYYMTASDAISYGLIDEVLLNQPD